MGFRGAGFDVFGKGAFQRIPFPCGDTREPPQLIHRDATGGGSFQLVVQHPLKTAVGIFGIRGGVCGNRIPLFKG